MNSQQTRKNDPHKLSRNEKIFLSMLAVLVVYIFIDFYILQDIRKERASEQDITISKNILITQSGYWGAYNENDYEKFRRLLNEKNDFGIRLFISNGKVFQIPEGKEAIIVESNFSLVKIRIESENIELWTSFNAIKSK